MKILLLLSVFLSACYVEPQCGKVTVVFKEKQVRDQQMCEKPGLKIENFRSDGLTTSSGGEVMNEDYLMQQRQSTLSGVGILVMCDVSGICNIIYDYCEMVTIEKRMCAEVATALMQDKDFNDSVLRIEQ